MQGRGGKNYTMVTDGMAIYSYGEHFPIAAWANDCRTHVVFNTEYYSVSTSGHQRCVKRALMNWRRQDPSRTEVTWVEETAVLKAFIQATGVNKIDLIEHPSPLSELSTEELWELLEWRLEKKYNQTPEYGRRQVAELRKFRHEFERLVFIDNI